jgi:hypothetical protein
MAVPGGSRNNKNRQAVGLSSNNPLSAMNHTQSDLQKNNSLTPDVAMATPYRHVDNSPGLAQGKKRINTLSNGGVNPMISS